MFANAPCNNENLYIRGTQIVKALYEKETNPTRKQRLLDTLGLVYDNRVKYFGKAGLYYAQKANDLQKYTPANETAVQEAYKMAFEKGATDVPPFAYTPYFKMVLKDLSAAKKTREEALAVYTLLNQTLEKQIANPLPDKAKDSVKYADASKKSSQFSAAQVAIDSDLASSLVKTCEEITQLFGPKYKANPTDKGTRNLMYALMVSKKCTDNPMFLEFATKKYVDEPTASLAYFIARSYQKDKKYVEAEKYFGEAIAKATNDSTKAQYDYDLALVLQLEGNYQGARAKALEAIRLRGNWGKPYMLIGDLYASSGDKCGEGIAGRSVYWAATDKYAKAKAIDPSVAEDAQAKMNRYSAFYPTKDELFFQSIKEGSSYSVGCWIGEGTTVRGR